MELLIPTLNKLISYQFFHILLEAANHEQLSQKHQFLWCSPLKYEVILLGVIFLGKKIMRGLF